MSYKIELTCDECGVVFSTYRNRPSKACSLRCSYIKRGKQKTTDLLGKTFGELKVISYVGSINNKVVWRCLCSCGVMKDYNSGDLTRKDKRKAVTCGNNSIHRKESRSKRWKGKSGLSSTYFSSVKASASKRGYAFDITIKDMADIFTGKCSLSGMPISYKNNASLDRIDSSKGYIKGNIQWVDKDVNRMKSDFDQDYFIKICKRIGNKNE